MLEFNRPTSSPAGFSAGVAEPVRIAAGQTTEQTSERFSLAESDELASAASTDSPTPVAQVQVQELSLEPLNGEPQHPAEPVQQGSAEQWLQGMLGQRELQVEARDEASVALLTPAMNELNLEQVPLSVPVQAAEGGAVWTNAATASAGRSALVVKPEVIADAVQAVPVAASPLQSTALAADAAAALNKPVDAIAKELGAPLASLLPSANGATALAVSTLPLTAQVEQPANLVQTHTVLSQPLTATQQRLLLEGPQARWGEQMLYALRDSVDLQLRQQVQNATIRLDPPELGSMEIFLSHESGRLNVQISASNGEVARLLQQTSDRLRQELVASNFLQVNVQVGSDGQSRSHGQRAAQWVADEHIAANQAAEQGAAAATVGQVQSDVLVTV